METFKPGDIVDINNHGTTFKRAVVVNVAKSDILADAYLVYHESWADDAHPLRYFDSGLSRSDPLPSKIVQIACMPGGEDARPGVYALLDDGRMFWKQHKDDAEWRADGALPGQVKT